MRKAFILFAVLLLASPVWANNAAPALTTSLFFTPVEMDKINAAVQKSPQMFVDKDAINLGAILYFGPESWTVWLKGEKWTPGMKRPNLHIMEVQEDRVTLSFSPREGTEKLEITLHPYQTYHISSGQITEGGG